MMERPLPIPNPVHMRDMVLNFIIPASNPAVRKLLHGLHLSLLANGMAQPDVEHTELVLAEVLNNIVEHAYADEKRGSIAMVARLREHVLQLEIVDTGAPMPDQQLPEGKLQTSDAIASLPEGGFGWHLIRALTDQLDYVREGNQNRLTLQIPRSKGAMC